MIKSNTGATAPNSLIVHCTEVDLLVLRFDTSFTVFYFLCSSLHQKLNLQLFVLSVKKLRKNTALYLL